MIFAGTLHQDTASRNSIMNPARQDHRVVYSIKTHHYDTVWWHSIMTHYYNALS